MRAVMIKGGDNPTVYAWDGVRVAALPPGWDQAGIMFGVLADQAVTVYAQSDIDALIAQQG